MDDALACAYTVVMLSLHGIETGRMIYSPLQLACAFQSLWLFLCG